MLVHCIYRWARSQPMKPAIIGGDDVPINYAAFSRAIDATRRFLEPHAVPVGRTVIVLVHSPPDAWIILLALRSLGLHTICLWAIDHALQLKLRNVAFVVVTESEPNSHKLQANRLPRINVIRNTRAIYANIHIGELPRIESNAFGGLIIYSSGTTGTPKKMVLDSTFEDLRNEWRARLYSFSKDTIT